LEIYNICIYIYNINKIHTYIYKSSKLTAFDGIESQTFWQPHNTSTLKNVPIHELKCGITKNKLIKINKLEKENHFSDHFLRNNDCGQLYIAILHTHTSDIIMNYDDLC
jgi:hypothetical protein